MGQRISQLHAFELADYFRKGLSVDNEICRFPRGSILGSRLGVHIGGPGFVGTRNKATDRAETNKLSKTKSEEKKEIVE